MDRFVNHSMRDFLSQSVTSLMHVADSKLGRSLWSLARRPGALTVAYMKGSRAPFMHPFRVFLVSNVLFFLMATIIGQSPLTTGLRMHMAYENFYHQPVAKQLVEVHLEQVGTEFEVYEAAFDRRVDTLAKSLVLVMLPLFAFLLGLLFMARKEPAVKHLAFSCHAYAHLLLFNFAIMLGILGLIFVFPVLNEISRDVKEVVVSVTSLVIMCSFFYYGVRRAYQTPRLMSAALGLVMTIGVYFLLFLYRALLFFATFYSLKF